MRINEVYKNSGLGKWFHGESATKEPGWDRYNSEGKRVGKCGDAEEGAAYSACLSKQKAQKLGKKGVGNFVKRKRKAQSKRGRGKKGSDSKGKKPIFVKTGAAKMNEEYELQLILEGKNKPNDPEKWSACKSAAKSKFDVYPSAYANAWAAKCYKKKGGTWRTIKEEIKYSVKSNILNNFMENAKPEFSPRGPATGSKKQRPKQFGKGGKAGTERTQDRREGKKQAEYFYEGKVVSDKEKMEDPSSIGPPIDQAIIDAATLGGSTPLRINTNVQNILRDEQAWRNKMDTHINNYADYINDLTKNIRLRGRGAYSRHEMYPEEGTR